MGTDQPIHHETPVLIVGAGPVGLIAAFQLARRGIRCMLVERSLETTKWPKMDITNCRSMELLKRLGLADELRQQGVQQDFSFDVLFSTGLSEGGELITKWDLPSPDDWRKRIRDQNDGSMPQEPYQRCSQAIFEAWLKLVVEAEPLIDSYFGLKFESLLESEDGVESRLTDIKSGKEHIVKSQYLIGSDGAGSRVRRSIGIELIGGPVPMAMYLVHFKSKDLSRLHKHGQFWHIFFSNGGVIISQDEVDTWTTHLPIPIDVDPDSLNPEQAVYQVLGGSIAPYQISIDKILVTSVWRPNIVIADRYRTEKGRVFLAGDSAHQNIPTGGYGMNTGLGDSFDIGWKLAAVLNSYGGEYLLQSYEEERWPVAARNVDRSGVHQSVHFTYTKMVRENPGTIIESSVEGATFRQQMKDYIDEHDGENKDHGIEMDYRHVSSVVIKDEEGIEPEWNPRDYTASTWPGARAPQVLLADLETSIFDLFGPDYTLVDFTADGQFASQFDAAAQKSNIPLKIVQLPNEEHVHKIWDTDAALIRPDNHVAWRSLASTPCVNAEHVLLTSVGKKMAKTSKALGQTLKDFKAQVGKKGFTATVGNVDQTKVERLAVFQT